MIDHAMLVLFVGLPIAGLLCRVLDVLMEPLHKRNLWQANMKPCPTCGARTSASQLAAHAPLSTAPQSPTPPAPLSPQP